MVNPVMDWIVQKKKIIILAIIVLIAFYVVSDVVLTARDMCSVSVEKVEVCKTSWMDSITSPLLYPFKLLFSVLR